MGPWTGSRSEDLAAVHFTYPRGDLIVTEFWLPNRTHTLRRPWSVDLLRAGEVQAQRDRIGGFRVCVPFGNSSVAL